MSGAFINQVEVPTNELPGNFGIRVLETMPTNLRDVYKDESHRMGFGFACDFRIIEIPENMPRPDRNDYVSEEEDSEDVNIFEIKVPPLETLRMEFEKDDEACQEY